jgi:hypothetical protein
MNPIKWGVRSIVFCAWASALVGCSIQAELTPLAAKIKSPSLSTTVLVTQNAEGDFEASAVHDGVTATRAYKVTSGMSFISGNINQTTPQRSYTVYSGITGKIVSGEHGL